MSETVGAARSRIRLLRAYDAKAVSDESAVDTGSESLVQQHYRDEVDMNTIARRFGLTREMPSGEVGGVYGDFTGITDFESAVAAVNRARDGFLALPAEVRDRFKNDPGQLLAYLRDRDEGQLEQDNVDFGFAERPAPAAPAAAAPAAPAAPPGAPAPAGA